jgi:hypothetical protein
MEAIVAIPAGRRVLLGGCDRANKPTWVVNIVCCRR